MIKGTRGSRGKWIVTCVMSAFFFYFWVNGPLKEISLLTIVDNAGIDIVQPVLVGKKKAKAQFNAIGEFQTYGDGFALIVNRKVDTLKSFALIDPDEIEILQTAYGDELLANSVESFHKKDADFNLQQTTNFFYVSIWDGISHYYYFQSKGISDQIKGYSGPINVGLFITEDAFIHQMVHVSSAETRSYMEKIAATNYYDQYERLSLLEAHEVDAIAGATISCQAMALTATDMVDKLTPNPMSELVDRGGIRNFEAKAILNWKWIPHIMIIFILFLYAFQKKLRKSKRFVLLTSISCVLFIGFYLNDSFTYVSFIHPFIGTSVSSFMGLYALFVLLGAIWGKNTYCKHICPYGNIQKLQLKVWKGASKKFFLPNKWVVRIRFLIAIALITGILAGFRNLSHLEPFPYIFGIEYQSLWYFMFAVFGLLINWIYPMIWCRLLCPTGSVLDTITELATKKISIKGK